MFCSVIIPLYNKEKHIEFAIHSVLKQQHQNFEIIVVDDGSTDAGPHLVKAIEDPRIQLIQQANSGVSVARNKGIALAKGELVCFLDADDWYHPEFLTTVTSMARKYPAISFFATDYREAKDPNNAGLEWPSGMTEKYETVDNFYSRWLYYSFFCTCSVAIRREYLNQFQPCFPPGENQGEDQDLWFRLVEKDSLVYCPAPLVGYRDEVEGSLTATYKVTRLIPAYLRLEQRALNHQMPDKHRTSALKVVTKAKVTIARKALMDSRRYDACLWLLKSFWLGIRTKRWWMTWVMCIFFTASYTKRWENWRLKKTA